ncbi:MAG: hypothetical protein E6J34_00050 [Chloroflexi bacterium]|nr:MAG: hypothetical protein E6J34_00050 [Chloroflexota bacterium]
MLFKRNTNKKSKRFLSRAGCRRNQQQADPPPSLPTPKPEICTPTEQGERSATNMRRSEANTQDAPPLQKSHWFMNMQSLHDHQALAAPRDQHQRRRDLRSVPTARRVAQ